LDLDVTARSENGNVRVRRCLHVLEDDDAREMLSHPLDHLPRKEKRVQLQYKALLIRTHWREGKETDSSEGIARFSLVGDALLRVVEVRVVDARGAGDEDVNVHPGNVDERSVGGMSLILAKLSDVSEEEGWRKEQKSLRERGEDEQELTAEETAAPSRGKGRRRKGGTDQARSSSRCKPACRARSRKRRRVRQAGRDRSAS
jgi:hypothetical protein